MSKVQLAVGQVWKTRGGQEVTITGNYNHKNFPFYGSNAEPYTTDGTIWLIDGDDHRDLIELVQDENGWRTWKATADGWIPYAGGGCPVDGGVTVEVRLRSGQEHVAEDAEAADYWDWDIDNVGGDIVAYRVVEQAPKAVDPVHAEAHSAQHCEAQEAPAIRLLQVAAGHMRDRAATYDRRMASGRWARRSRHSTQSRVAT